MYAYVNATTKIKTFLDKIQDVGVPPKVTQNWLAGIGFRSTNDRALTSMLKQIKFVDGNAQPTRYWEDYRSGNRKILAQGIREGYPVFYATYGDAHQRSSADLENLVKSGNPKINQDTVRRAISTFKALVAEADFDETDSAKVAAPSTASNGVVATREFDSVASNDNAHVQGIVATPLTVAQSLGTGLTVNVNVQLTLPETTDGTVYEKLFAAMREHLLGGSTHAA